MLLNSIPAYWRSEPLREYDVANRPSDGCADIKPAGQSVASDQGWFRDGADVDKRGGEIDRPQNTDRCS